MQAGFDILLLLLAIRGVGIIVLFAFIVIATVCVLVL